MGSTCAVIGSSIATVTAGPRPGSTPMAVPSAQPTKAHSRLIGVPAVAKPPQQLVQSSMACPVSDPAGVGEARQVDRQHLGEQPEHRRGDEHAGHGVQHAPARAAAGPALRRLRRPRTASMKHSVQLRMKPMLVISAALASSPADTQASAVPVAARRRPTAASRSRKPPVARLPQQEQRRRAPAPPRPPRAGSSGRRRRSRRRRRCRVAPAAPAAREQTRAPSADQRLGALRWSRCIASVFLPRLRPSCVRAPACRDSLQTMPALTIVARRLANSRSTKSSNSLPVSSAGVQLFFSSASAQALLLRGLDDHVGQRLALRRA